MKTNPTDVEPRWAGPWRLELADGNCNGSPEASTGRLRGYVTCFRGANQPTTVRPLLPLRARRMLNVVRRQLPAVLFDGMKRAADRIFLSKRLRARYSDDWNGHFVKVCARMKIFLSVIAFLLL